MLSRELEAVQDYMNSSSPLLEIAGRQDSPAFHEYCISLRDASVAFGMSELFGRRGERHKVLGTSREEAAFGAARCKFYNERGLALLGHAQRSLSDLRSEVAATRSPKFPAAGEAKLKEFSQHFLAVVADLEIKASDAKKIRGVLEETVLVARRGGHMGLIDHFEAKTRELARLRRRSDRGAVDNIAYWKLVFIALLIGVALWFVIRCVLNRKGCSSVEMNAIMATGLTLGKLLLKFC